MKLFPMQSGRWIAVIAAIAMISCGEKAATAPQDSQLASRMISVKVEPGLLKRVVRAAGTVQPVQAVSVYVPSIPGQYQLTLTRLAAGGTHVKAGDLVAEFDNTTQLQAARDAQARYVDLTHQIEQRKAQQRSSDEQRAMDVQSAEADLAKARLELKRGRLLSEIDRLKQEARVEDAQTHLASLKKSHAFRQQAEGADLKILELQRERQKVALERAESNAGKLRVIAPIAGMIALGAVYRSGSFGHPQEGDQLYAGQQLVRIFNTKQMEVHVSMGEPDGAALIPNSRATVRVDAYPDRTFNARFLAASPVAASNSPFDTSIKVVNFLARYLLETTDSHLLPDLAAAVDVAIVPAKPVLLAPRSAILHRPSGPYVLVPAGAEGRRERGVKLGAFDDTHVEITGGLSAGDLILAPAPEPARGKV